MGLVGVLAHPPKVLLKFENESKVHSWGLGPLRLAPPPSRRAAVGSSPNAPDGTHVWRAARNHGPTTAAAKDNNSLAASVEHRTRVRQLLPTLLQRKLSSVASARS